MKYGIFSDIHGNFNALQFMFQHYDKLGVSKYICLGDIIHDGRETKDGRCIDLIEDMECKVVRGNHEDRFLEERYIVPAFIRDIRYLECLPKIINLGEYIFVHNFARANFLFNELDEKDKDLSIGEIADEVQELSKQYPHVNAIFLGYNHNIKAFRYDRENTKISELEVNNIVELDKEGVYIFSPGTVGLPKGPWLENRFSLLFSYSIFDTEKRTFEVKLL